MALQIPKYVPLIDPDISHYPDNPATMSPHEATYRDKYKKILCASDDETDLIACSHKAIQEYQAAKENVEQCTRVLYAANTIFFSVLLAAFVMTAIFLSDSDMAEGWYILALIVCIVLYILLTKIPRDARNAAYLLQQEAERKKTQCEKDLKAHSNIKNSSETLSVELANEFFQWANERNRIVEILTEKPFHEYMGLPFEPVLNDEFFAVGTEDEPTKYIVYTKWKPNMGRYTSYKYHRIPSCIQDSKYDPPTELPIGKAKELNMLPCQTCFFFAQHIPDWILSIHKKYKQEISSLENLDILVSLNSHHHTEVTFLPIELPDRKFSHMTTAEFWKKHYLELSESAAKYQAIADHFDGLSEDAIEQVYHYVDLIRDSKIQINTVGAGSPSPGRPIAESPKPENGTYAEHLFLYALSRLESESENLFYDYPSMRDFYQQVADKRFHRAMIEGMSFDNKVDFSTVIRSKHGTYHTSLSQCDCADFQETNKPCKHMLFLAYHTGVLFVHKCELEKNMKVYLDELRSTKPKK